MIRRLILGLALFLLVAFPLSSGYLRGLPDDFFRFPPLVVHYPVHAPFSFPVFGAFSALFAFAAILLLCPRSLGFSAAPPTRSEHPGPGRQAIPTVAPPPRSLRPRFPAHGWFGLLLLGLSWAIAWSPLPLPGNITRHTFFPLWIGFILVLDGLVYRRSGHSLGRNRRSVFFLLFPVSALSWWYYEFLNRFVQNWWYPDRTDFGHVHYLVYSSLCFSTVLPAIFEIRDLLATVPGLRSRWSRGPKAQIPHAAALFFLLGLALLPLIPFFPDPLFFATWLAPLALLAGALGLARVKTPFDSIRNGDWSPVLLLALASLCCGFFWEMWNHLSSPRWAYAIPYVQRFHLFAMPAVGYAGYLPFGPVCACFWLAWTGLLRRQGSGTRVQGSAGSDLPFLNPNP